MVEYSGRRDPRFVRIHRGGLLDEAHHRLLAAWAAACAEHVLPIFTADHPEDDRPRRAIEAARAWSRGEATVLEAREAAYAAHAAAREASSSAASQVARAAGHAAATAHMADHELGAALFAIKAVRLTAPVSGAIAAGNRECLWQREQLPTAVRELVLSDEERRNEKLGSLFGHARRYVVLEDHDATYANPISLRAGERVTVGQPDADFPGWLWCIGPDGRSGWVPEVFLDLSTRPAIALRQYDAIELTVRAGEEVSAGEEVGGWVWATTARGVSGWVPTSKLRVVP